MHLRKAKKPFMAARKTSINAAAKRAVINDYFSKK